RLTRSDAMQSLIRAPVCAFLRPSFLLLLIRPPPRSPLFPYTTLFRSRRPRGVPEGGARRLEDGGAGGLLHRSGELLQPRAAARQLRGDESLRGAAVASVRCLQPRLDQRRTVRQGRRRRLGSPADGGSPVHAFPR